MELSKTFSKCRQWWHQTEGIKKYPLTTLFILALGAFIVSLLANQQVGVLKNLVITHQSLQTLPLIISSLSLGALCLALCIAYHKREKALEVPPPPPLPPPPEENPFVLLRERASEEQIQSIKRIEPEEAAEQVRKRILDLKQNHHHSLVLSHLGITSLPEDFFTFFPPDFPIDLSHNQLSNLPQGCYLRPYLDYSDNLHLKCMFEIRNLIVRCKNYPQRDQAFAFLQDINLKQLQERLLSNGRGRLNILKFFFSTVDPDALKNTIQYKKHPEMMDLRVAKLINGLSQKQEFFDEVIKYLRSKENACGDEKILSLMCIEAIFQDIYELASPQSIIGRFREILLEKEALECARGDGEEDEDLEYVLFFKKEARELLDLPIYEVKGMRYACMVHDASRNKLANIIQTILDWTNTPEKQCEMLLGSKVWNDLLENKYLENYAEDIKRQLKTFQKKWKADIKKKQKYIDKLTAFNKQLEPFTHAAFTDEAPKERLLELLKDTCFKAAEGANLEDLSREDLVDLVNKFIGEEPKILLRDFTLAILRGQPLDQL